jgi:site-specific recombinase XerC
MTLSKRAFHALAHADRVRPDAKPTEADWQKLLAASKDQPRDYAILHFMNDAKARTHGVCALTLDSLDLANNTATVPGKGARRRDVTLSDETVAALRAWLAVRPETDHDRVFTSLRPGYAPLSASSFCYILMRSAGRAPVQGVGQ